MSIHIARASSMGELPAEVRTWLQPDRAANLFLTEAWLELLHEHVFSTGASVEYWYALNGAPQRESGAILPLVFPADGACAQGLSNYYSALFGPVTFGDSASAVALLSQILRKALGAHRWDTLELGPMVRDGPAAQATIAAFKHARLTADSFFRFGNWYRPVAPGDFASFERSLPSQLRNTVARKRKQLAASGKLEIVVITEGEALQAALDDFERVYQSSWKQPEPYAPFIRAFAERAAQRGWLRLGVLRVDGVALASQMWFVFNRTAYIFKLAYDSAQAKLSPGSVLSMELMRHVIEHDRVEIIDYLTGDDAYKQAWMTERRELIGIVGFNPWRPRGALQAVRHLVGKLRRHAASSRGAGAGLAEDQEKRESVA